MHAIALLALAFGFTGMILLDGQVFTHAVTGIVCGTVSIVCGIALIQRDRDRRWIGWVIAALGLGLAIWCGIEAPSAYPRQEKFNRRSREHREKIEGHNSRTRNTKRSTAFESVTYHAK
jgi:hypothetical protein